MGGTGGEGRAFRHLATWGPRATSQAGTRCPPVSAHVHREGDHRPVQVSLLWTLHRGWRLTVFLINNPSGEVKATRHRAAPTGGGGPPGVPRGSKGILSDAASVRGEGSGAALPPLDFCAQGPWLVFRFHGGASRHTLQRVTTRLRPGTHTVLRPRSPQWNCTHLRTGQFFIPHVFTHLGGRVLGFI